MNFLLKKIYTIVRSRGLRDLFYAIFFRILSTLRKLFLKSNFKNTNYKKWSKIKNKYIGERVFLIGNGPSLNITELYLLKNEYTFCFNHFDLFLDRLNWNPTFYSITDDLVFDDKRNKNLEKIIKNSKYSFFPHIHFKGKNFKNKVNNHENILWTNQKFGKGFSTNLPNIFQGGTVIYEAFQILVHMGFKEIYFLGVDMNYTIHKTVKKINKVNKSEIEANMDDDPNHFDPRYFGKGKKYHQPEEYIVDNIMKNLKNFHQFSIENNLSVFNSGYNSKVNYFTLKPLKQIFNSADQLFKFNLLVKMVFNVNSFEILKNKICELKIDEIENIKAHNYDFWIYDKKTHNFIKSYLSTHTVIGPYKSLYFFKKKRNLSL